jgi:hypothetical protein
MPLPPDIRQRIRDKLDGGALPADRPERMYVGFGRDHSCAACDKPIGASEVEFEIAYYSGERTYRFHLRCAGAWETARSRHAASQSN